MEVELQGGTIWPQFRVEIAPLIKQSNAHFGPVRVPLAFGESFPISSARLKSLEIHCNNEQSVHQSAVSTSDSCGLPELCFDRLQPTEHKFDGLNRRHFGRYIAREAALDEEYWTAAWLRAEAHSESVSCMRHADARKRKYAEQEFYALKRRCSGLDGNSIKCFCLVAVKREEKSNRRNVINSVVGTLDLSIRQFFRGETYPGDTKRSVVFASPEPLGAHRYAYIANVCVSKFARRQGIASNLLYLATDVAISSGMKQLYVHVNADNEAGQQLYAKTGFKAVSLPFSKSRKLLLVKEL